MRIWLVRHGESMGNADEKAWAHIPDHRLPLTEFGVDQAKHAGDKIRGYYKNDPKLKDRKLRLWYSPYVRTAQTKGGIVEGLGEDMIENRNHKKTPGWEDERLREQDFGMFSRIYSKEEQFKRYPLEAEHFYNIKDHMGCHWAKAPMGESRADVCLRISDFIRTMMDDVRAGKEDMLIVTHGVTMRAFEKRFMHRDVEWFEKEPNPPNCGVVLIEGDTHGYTATKIFPGPERPPHLPKTHKITPIGGWEALKEEYGYEPSGHLGLSL